jgi:hypothetical protein
MMPSFNPDNPGYPFNGMPHSQNLAAVAMEAICGNISTTSDFNRDTLENLVRRGNISFEKLAELEDFSNDQQRTALFVLQFLAEVNEAHQRFSKIEDEKYPGWREKRAADVESVLGQIASQIPNVVLSGILEEYKGTESRIRSKIEILLNE